MKNIKTFESFNYELINESIGIFGSLFLAWCAYKFFKGLVDDIKMRTKKDKEELIFISTEFFKEIKKNYPNLKNDCDKLEKKIIEDIESGDCKSLKDLKDILLTVVK